MAQNRKTNQDPPPHVSDSELEEEGSSSSSDEEESDSSEESEEETPPPSTSQITKKPSAQNKPHPPSSQTTPTKPQPYSSSSESDSETTPENSPNIKPIASKPMDQPNKKPTKNPRSKPTFPPSSPSKRPADTQPTVDSKKQKMDPKKQLFQRLWSDDDQIAILNGMIEYTAEKGADPVSEMNLFYEFVKKSLHVDVTKAQLSDKVRRLKKKYKINASKEKTGTDSSFLKPHDQRAYELSKKIWGFDDGAINDVVVVDNSFKGKGNPSQRGSKGLALGPTTPKVEGNNVEKVVVEHDEGPSSSFQICRGSIGDGRSLEEGIVKGGLEIIKGTKRAELEEKWKKLYVKDVELFLERNELICEQTRAILEVLKSGD